MKLSRETLSVAATVAIYPTRLVQFGSLVITGYAVCYLVWMHHFHYCAFYGCGTRVPDSVSVPVGEVIMITAVRTLRVYRSLLWPRDLHRESRH